MSRQFVWLIPVTNLCLFLALGLGLCAVIFVRRRRGSWLALRLLCTLTLLPTAVMAVPQIYDWAWLLVSMGLATRLVPILEWHRAGFRRLVRVSLPVIAGLVAILATSMWAGDRIKERREAARPLPPPGSPNVLLIVLDTVAADHLSLHGYNRPTSTTLDELAGHGIRFDAVQAAAPWTLPSHAVMFTGKWPHELAAGWLTPLDAASPTLAEVMGAQGYATAGFVANKWYCASDSGLGRGFTVYRDYLFPKLTAFGMSALVSRPMQWLPGIADFLDGRFGTDVFWRMGRYMSGLFNANRLDAGMIDCLFLDWLSARSQPERPFFAFLNFSDAHDPYQLPELALHRFGVRPRTSRDVNMILNWSLWDKQGLSARDLAMARDAYDSCIAYVDEQLGRLIDELERRGILDTTWVIVAADHGESFGEHAGVFWHGTSLYRTELHVPLVILPPTRSRSPRVVSEPVSLRDMAATIVRPRGFPEPSAVSGAVPGPVLARARRPDGFQRRRAAGLRSGAGRSGPQRSVRSGPRAAAQASVAIGRLDRGGLDLHPP